MQPEKNISILFDIMDNKRSKIKHIMKWHSDLGKSIRF